MPSSIHSSLSASIVWFAAVKDADEPVVDALLVLVALVGDAGAGGLLDGFSLLFPIFPLTLRRDFRNNAEDIRSGLDNNLWKKHSSLSSNPNQPKERQKDLAIATLL